MYNSKNKNNEKVKSINELKNFIKNISVDDAVLKEDEILNAFINMIKIKDKYTYLHVRETADYSVEICKALNIPIIHTDRIKKAAMVHDLGKILINENILFKDKKLSTTEYEEIKKHPLSGISILENINSLNDLIPMILYHHERWDGLGYPHGLKGKEIPLGAHIISIADYYQALISDRPYRGPFSKEEAINIIRGLSGSQFDPNIVDVFLEVFE